MSRLYGWEAYRMKFLKRRLCSSLQVKSSSLFSIIQNGAYLNQMWSQKGNSSLKKCPKFGVSLKKMFLQCIWWPESHFICTFNKNKHFSPEIILSTLQVGASLRFKARLSEKPLIWKWFILLMQIKLIFTTKVFALCLVLKVKVSCNPEITYWRICRLLFIAWYGTKANELPHLLVSIRLFW